MSPWTDEEEALARDLHEAGREAVERGWVVNQLGKPFQGWDEISDQAQAGRKLQARYLLAHGWCRDPKYTGAGLAPLQERGGYVPPKSLEEAQAIERAGGSPSSLTWPPHPPAIEPPVSGVFPTPTFSTAGGPVVPPPAAASGEVAISTAEPEVAKEIAATAPPPEPASPAEEAPTKPGRGKRHR
jgi:hypothetical protein